MNQDAPTSDLQDIRTSILLYSFLQNSSDCSFILELCTLKPQFLPLHDFDDGELQTDGNRLGVPQSDMLVSQTDQEILRLIGTQLAEIGDKLTAEFDPSDVQWLAQQFTMAHISQEGLTRHMSQAVQSFLRTRPLEMEQERAALIVAMVLAKKVANIVPSLLHRVFSTTVNYINHSLHDYVNNLAPES